MYTKAEIQMFRSMDERGFVLEDYQELAVLKEDVATLLVEIERLRAALRFYAGWPQGPEGNIAPLLLDSGAIARAALEGPQDRIGTGGDE